MAQGLKGRLARLRELGLSKPGAPVAEEGEATVPSAAASDSPSNAPGPSHGRPSFLEGWTRECEFVWTRELRYPSPLPDSLDLAPFGPLARRSVPANAVAGIVAADELRFFDLETTGLSGGTGTIAFLAAVGRRVGPEFAVRQFFLQDYPGEGPYVSLVLEALQGGTIASYNGRAFDVPLLRTRCVMNGLRFPEFPHVDALYAARRLWKRACGGATLGAIERGALGVERSEDVPGSLIPEIWLGFLRTGDHPLMAKAMSHNAEDVRGLAGIVALAARIFADPRAWSSAASVDLGGLGRSLLAAGRRAEAEEALEAALAGGDEAAGILLCRDYRRSGRLGDLSRVVAALPDGYRSRAERARHAERELADIRAALAWATRAAEAAPPGRARDALDRRVARLARKLARIGGH